LLEDAHEGELERDIAVEVHEQAEVGLHLCITILLINKLVILIFMGIGFDRSELAKVDDRGVETPGSVEESSIRDLFHRGNRQESIEVPGHVLPSPLDIRD